MTQENTALLEALKKAQGWMREPDNAEHFGTDEIIRWLNERPTHAIPKAIAALSATPTTDSLTADAAAMREQAAKVAEGHYPMTNALWSCGQNIAAAIRALPLPAQTVPADVAAPGDVTDAPAAADGELCKLLDLIETADEHGNECAIVEQAAKVRAALAQPKGGE